MERPRRPKLPGLNCSIPRNQTQEESMFDRDFMRARMLTLVPFLLSASPVFAQVFLISDGQTAAYTQVQNAFGASPETPDCSHTSFGPHITQAPDSTLGKSVFI